MPAPAPGTQRSGVWITVDRLRDSRRHLRGRCYRRADAHPPSLHDRGDRPVALRSRRGGPRPDPHHPAGGKLKAIAKGIRRPTSRLGGSLEPFAELTVALARGRTFDVVTQVSVGHAWLNLRDARERGDRLVPGRARRPVPRGAPRRRTAVPPPPASLRAARCRDGTRAGRPLVRDAPARRARPATRGRSLRRMRPRPRGRRAVPLGAAARRRRCASGAPVRARPDGLSLDALKLLKAYQRLDIEAIAGLRLAAAVEREVEAALREFVRTALERDARSLAFLDEVRREP